MGLDIAHVVSDSRHHGAFLCAICQSLCGLDALVTTTCSHVFCRSCLETWLGRSREREMKCPTCNSDLRLSSGQSGSGGAGSGSNDDNRKSMVMGDLGAAYVQALSEHEPLAHRVLRRVEVSCPLKAKHGCGWTGDYGDLHPHLLSSTAHLTPTIDIGEAMSSVGPMHEVTPCSPLTPPSSVQTTQNMTQEETCGHANQPSRKPQDHKQEQHRQIELATSFKVEGNHKFETAEFADATDLYSRALSILLRRDLFPSLTNQLDHDKQQHQGNTNDPDGFDPKAYRTLLSSLMANRAAANYKLEKYATCAEDCLEAVKVHDTYVKAYVRGAKAMNAMGQFDRAYDFLSQGLSRHSNSSSSSSSSSKILKEERKRTATFRNVMARGVRQLQDPTNAGNYAAARATFAELLQHCTPTAVPVVLGAARAETGLGLTDAALRRLRPLLRSDHGRRNPDILTVQGHCLCIMGEFDRAFPFLKEALRMDPDAGEGGGNVNARVILKQYKRVQALLAAARDATFHRRFREAVGSLTEALATFSLSGLGGKENSIPRLHLPVRAPLYADIYNERAKARLRLRDYSGALDDSSAVLHARPDDEEAWLTKATSLRGLGRHRQARDELAHLLQGWGAGRESIITAHERADFDLRKSLRPDYYHLLGVPSVASTMEIKKQYKVRALQLHPDRLSGPNNTDEDRKQAEEQFKLLGQGLEVLCDDFKRQLYDEGYDDEAIRERVEAAQQAAHRRQHHNAGSGGHHYHGGHW